MNEQHSSEDGVVKRTTGRQVLRRLREWLFLFVLGGIGLHLVGQWRAPALAGPAPAFELRDLNGALTRLADFRGRPVVLNFWATWCGPCRFEIPSFSSFAVANPEVAVLGIAVDGTRETLQFAVDELGIEYPVLRGRGDVQAAYGVSTLPTTVVIDRLGQVISTHTGIMFRPQLEWVLRGQ